MIFRRLERLGAVTTEQWDRMFAVNARGAFLCYKYAIKQMIQQGHGGRIVGASSAAGLKGSPRWPHYSATKFAVRGLTQAVGGSKDGLFCRPVNAYSRTAQEVGKHGITVNAYAPGKDLNFNRRIMLSRYTF